MPIPTHVLLTAVDFNAGLRAAAIGVAIARGLKVGGLPEPDLIVLPRPPKSGAADIRELLDSLDFDTRMRAARAVVIADGHLSERTLAGSATFEIATRARQAGVPAYAVAAENKLDTFDARILDLQAILEAGSARALAAAGRKLAGIVFSS
ncbi:MAG TPA: glycerate kinase [Solirubrobacteraceae bacterium]|nr:glycerate kinase [Solirubrobacteraceae bacterium]